MSLQIESTAHPDIRLLTPARFDDPRGTFSETWNARTFAEVGIGADFCQDNQSWSRQAGTVRGLHFQAPPFAQAKLVRVVRGAIIDVAVDARRHSRHFGQWIRARLSAESGAQIFIPRGFLHGFATLEADTVVLYKVDAHYDAGSSGSVRWDDPDLAIDWGLGERTPVLSKQDAEAVSWSEFRSPF